MKRRAFNAMLYWCRERERIRIAKESGKPPPWTTDPILQTYRFCNLRRRDDRVSRWLIDNVLARREEFSDWSFLQFTALCRWVNWPNTIQILHDEGLWPSDTLDLESIGGLLNTLEGKVWTGAYMIRAPDGPYTSMGKGRFVSEIIIGEALESNKQYVLEAIETQSVANTWSALTRGFCWGSFMSGQVVADWTYCPVLREAKDLYTWAPQGPGSVRGYNRMLSLPLKQGGPDMDTWCRQLQDWRGQILRVLGPDYNDVTLHDVQNVLCETDKWLRVSTGEGRPRSIYKSHEGLY